ncbi:sodium/calcium exchanger regulatory protein 1-like [Galendromus occidentalis]|uniref:Sodium/calcium exchanger regulatory protein 1-like n=1 Tax=Galendromus occidentalis TaxID=34638 RepID=A0AAJ6QTR7_9ACAR|nr:sodium/calcium exchanger regulatory protein 1-like [Galendromus occidentalis]
MADASPLFNGIWKSIDSTGFEDFLQAIDIGVTWRVLASGSNPSIEISVDGKEWTIKTHTLLRTHELSFRVDEEFLEKRIDGVRVKTICTLEDGKLVQTCRGDKTIEITRELLEDGDQLLTTFAWKDIKATRLYRRSNRITR